MVVKIQVKPKNVNVNIPEHNKKNQSQFKKEVVKNWRLFIKEHIGIIKIIVIKVWPFKIGKNSLFEQIKLTFNLIIYE